MRLLEQLQLMKQLGIQGSDEDLTARLKKVGYNMERAISDYFDAPPLPSNNSMTQVPKIKASTARAPLVSVQLSERSVSNGRGVKRHVPDSSSSLSSKPKKPPSPSFATSSSVPRSTRCLSPPVSAVTQNWLLGRRVTLGYTLNAGFALRETPLRLRFEGVLAHHQKGSSNSSSSGSGVTGQKKKKQKFSAANLMFECEPQPSHDAGAHTSSPVIRGRLSNLLCNFLVPLLQNEMIIVTGHIAFDYGKVGVFQDLPLSLQILATPRFFLLMGAGGEADSDEQDSRVDSWTGAAANSIATQLGDGTGQKTIAAAGNELLVWLTEGEDALLAAKAADKKLVEYTETLAPSTGKGNDQGDGVGIGDGDGVVVDNASSSVNIGSETEIDSKGDNDLLAGSSPSATVEISGDGAALMPASVTTTDVMEGGGAEVMLTASQPKLITGIQMKKYQLQALQWMKSREEGPQHDVEGAGRAENPRAGISTDSRKYRDAAKVIVLESDSDDNDFNDDIDSDGAATLPAISSVTLTLPIEGVLQSPDPALSSNFPPRFHSLVGKEGDEKIDEECEPSSLWTPLLGLRISSNTASNTTNSAVTFYSPQDIADIITTSQQDQQNEPSVKRLWWNRYTQRVSAVPPSRLSHCRGGILADQMGLGKTIMAIALIVSDFDHNDEMVNRLDCTATVNPNNKDGDDAPSVSSTSSTSWQGQAYFLSRQNNSSSDRTRDGGTLIICPLSLMSQWLEEFRSRVLCRTSGGRDGLRVVMYYGADRDRPGSGDGNLDFADVVITSYGVLTSEWRRSLASSTSSASPRGSSAVASRSQQRLPLLGREWRRVILDEGHTIRNPATDSARACHLIRAQRRWVLSGTPVQNKIDDLYSLMKFLKHQPWDKWRWWYTTVTQPSLLAATTDTPSSVNNHNDHNHGNHHHHENNIEKGSYCSNDPEAAPPLTPTRPANKGISVVRRVLSSIMLRRTKDTVDTETGQPIVMLPPRDVQYIFVDLSPVERSFYDALAKRSSSQMLGILTRQQQLTFKKGVASGKAKSALTGYAELFTLLMRLRQTCDHPVLVLQSLLEKQSLHSLLAGQSSRQGNIPSYIEDSGGGNDSGSNVDIVECKTDQHMRQSESFARIKDKFLGRKGGGVNTVYLNDVLKSLEQSWKVPEDQTITVTGSSHLDRSDESTESNCKTYMPIEQQECCVCFEFLATPEHTALTPCAHILCWSCATLAVETTGSCPLCQQNMTREELIPLAERSVEENGEQWLDNNEMDKREASRQEGTGKATEASSLRSFLSKSSSKTDAKLSNQSSGDQSCSNILGSINWQTSSKLFALQQELEKIFSPSLCCRKPAEEEMDVDSGGCFKDMHPEQQHPKVVIFSQWTGMLDLVETMIQTLLVQKQSTSKDPETTAGDSDMSTNSSSTDVTAPRGESSQQVSSAQTSNLTGLSQAIFKGAGSTKNQEGTVKQYFSGENSNPDDGAANEQYRYNLRPDCSVRFDGSLSQAHRAQALHRFSTDPHARLLLISLKAGGVGLNLTAASYLFLLDPWWNPAVEDQAIDRVHRLGQLHTVKIMRMVCRDTVEEKLLALQARKRRISRQALGEGGGEAGQGQGSKLSLDELKGLFL